MTTSSYPRMIARGYTRVKGTTLCSGRSYNRELRTATQLRVLCRTQLAA